MPGETLGAQRERSGGHALSPVCIEVIDAHHSSRRSLCDAAKMSVIIGELPSESTQTCTAFRFAGLLANLQEAKVSQVRSAALDALAEVLTVRVRLRLIHPNPALPCW